MNIANLDKAQVLAALYDNAVSGGNGLMAYDPNPMTIEQARALLERQTSFDWLQGRVMKVDLGKDELDTFLYDRDNGDGAAARALAPLLSAGDGGAP